MFVSNKRFSKIGRRAGFRNRGHLPDTYEHTLMLTDDEIDMIFKPGQLEQWLDDFRPHLPESPEEEMIST